MHVLISIRVGDKLYPTGRIAQLDENHAAQISPNINPSSQADLGALVCYGQLPGVMGSLQRLAHDTLLHEILPSRLSEDSTNQESGILYCISGSSPAPRGQKCCKLELVQGPQITIFTLTY